MDVRDTYLAAWNETDRAARDALLASGWAATATYTDPMAEARGVDAVSDVIGAVHGHFPGLVFAPLGDVETHHDVARFRWGLGLPGAEPAAVGSDVVTLDTDGRIATVVGFLDQVPGSAT